MYLVKTKIYRQKLFRLCKLVQEQVLRSTETQQTRTMDKSSHWFFRRLDFVALLSWTFKLVDPTTPLPQERPAS